MSTVKLTNFQIEPPKFSGSFDEDAYKFLFKYIETANANGWNEDTRLSVIPLCLQGPAYQWWHYFVASRAQQQKLHNDANAAQAAATAALTASGSSGAVPVIIIPPALNMDVISVALQTSFRSVADKEIAEMKLYNRCQQIGELPEAFVYGMLDLINDFDSSILEDEKVRLLIRKMRPSYIVKINPIAPKTIEELLTCLRKIAETQYMIDHSESMVNAISAQLEKLNAQFNQNLEEELAKAVSDIKHTVQPENMTNVHIAPAKSKEHKEHQITERETFQRNSPHRFSMSATTTDSFQCYRCGRNGHIARNCRVNMSIRKYPNYAPQQGNRANMMYGLQRNHPQAYQQNMPPIFCISCRDNSHRSRDCPYLNMNGTGLTGQQSRSHMEPHMQRGPSRPMNLNP